MKIRDATPRDLDAIVAIYNATVPSRMVTADTTPVTVASRRAWFDAHDPTRHPCWVVDAGEDAIAAWLSFEPFKTRPAYHRTAEISIYVAETFRRAGLGRTLLARAIEKAPSLGLRTLTGAIFGHNAPSLALFESFGFSRWGTLPRVAELDGVERDLVLVGLRLM